MDTHRTLDLSASQTFVAGNYSFSQAKKTVTQSYTDQTQRRTILSDFADLALKEAEKTGNLDLAQAALEAYDHLRIQKGSTITNQLLRAGRIAANHWIGSSPRRERVALGIEEYIHNHPVPADQKLRQYSGAVAAVFGLGIGLLLIDPTVEGFVVSENVSLSAGWLGALCLIIGLIGLVVWEKSR